LVDVRPVAQQRVYSLKPQPFKELDDWLRSYRRLWEQRYDRFESVLQELQQKENDCGHRQ